MNRNHGACATKTVQWLREPTVHFLVIGAFLFLIHRLIAGDPRTIEVTPALRNDLTQRFRDQTGRWPNPAELETALHNWKSDEALYREALRERLERNDEIMRSALAERIRARAASEAPQREPTESDLEQWLAQHRELYEAPRLYEYEYVTFKRSPDKTAEELRKQYERAIKAGRDRASLGRPVFAAKLPRELIREQLGPELTERICSLAVGEWTPLENQESLFLARLNATEGGLPSPDVLHARMQGDWKAFMQQQAVEHAVQTIVDRYRFVERTR
ncbi:MAG TPA: peptidylprolyl isomerase [Polyangiaceae bacterium]